ncbi:MAG: hypothetical protein QM733_10180 [Ilumatobacteraceae bacterium]
MRSGEALDDDDDDPVIVRAAMAHLNLVMIRLVEYAEAITLTDATASRDLRALVDAALLDPRGERRGRPYVAGVPLREAWQVVRELRSRRASPQRRR